MKKQINMAQTRSTQVTLVSGERGNILQESFRFLGLGFFGW